MKKLKHKKVKGMVKVLKALMYKGHMVYIRMIGDTYFEYLLEYNGEIYSSYIIIKPANGKKKLTQDEIKECVALIFSGAETTLELLTGQDSLDEKTKKAVEIFEENRDKFETNEQ